MKLPAIRLAAALLATPAPAFAQSEAGDRHRAAGADVFYSTDADDTEVVRAGADLDLVREGPDDYAGVRIERAWFNPQGQGWARDDRAYLRAADTSGRWDWAARIGTDGRTVLGAASVHDDSRFRKELFVERDLVETPTGVAGDLYQTFVGAALDVPLGARDTVALVAGLQNFTGRNRRVHLRANYVHVLSEAHGLSAQLRGRWFRNSHPRELDYYSPRWYAQILPVLQWRRTTDSGWRLRLAGGAGLQRDSDSDWRRSSYALAEVTTPVRPGGWALTGAATFSETPTTGGSGYRYFQVSASIVRGF